jgi:hypothetical protein
MRRQRRRIERQQIAHARRERRRVISRFAADNGMTYQQALDLEAEMRHEQRDREAIEEARAAEQAWPEDFAPAPDPTPGVEAFRRVVG